MLSVRLPPEDEARLAAVAKRTGRTKSHYVRDLILEALEDLEDLADAEERIQAIRDGRSRTYTLEEVEQQLGLVD
jgi:RHH-type rel operon transcriptional repressor/antitoxin RelB